VPSAGHAHLYEPAGQALQQIILARADPTGTVSGTWTLVSRFRFFIQLRYVVPRNYGSEDRMDDFRRMAPYRWTPAVMLDPIREVHNDRLRGRGQRHVGSRK